MYSVCSSSIDFRCGKFAVPTPAFAVSIRNSIKRKLDHLVKSLQCQSSFVYFEHPTAICVLGLEVMQEVGVPVTRDGLVVHRYLHACGTIGERRAMGPGHNVLVTLHGK